MAWITPFLGRIRGFWVFHQCGLNTSLIKSVKACAVSHYEVTRVMRNRRVVGGARMRPRWLRCGRGERLAPVLRRVVSEKSFAFSGARETAVIEIEHMD